MNAGRILWVLGGYAAGTFPSALIVARARGGAGLPVIRAARRGAGEADPHILLAKLLGSGWAAVVAVADVLKALILVLVARELGHLSPRWLALVGVAVVVGHAFPFYARHMAGRGLAAMAGVFLVLLPWEMVIAGALIVLGVVVRATGLASTLAAAAVPVVAAAQGQPAAFVAMAGTVFVLILLRRLEGVRGVVRSGIPPLRAAVYRCLFDASVAPQPPRAFWIHRP